ncbi:hypothetical protein [Streptomyces sp. Tue6028]|uniref:hypothetical protein n=1 Tax=Streptomyces sp. Tue6028 TaxID=2036037 RepID=UPI003D73A2FD
MLAPKAIYTALTEQATEQALDALAASDLGGHYSGVVQTWSSATASYCLMSSSLACGSTHWLEDKANTLCWFGVRNSFSQQFLFASHRGSGCLV